MTDSHIPNSEATPGWKKHPFPRTNFLDAIKTTPVEGFDGSRYAGHISVDWCSGAGSKGKLPALGGLLGGAALGAARQFSCSKFPARTEHDPLSIYIEFLETVPQGNFHVALKVLQSGISQSTLQAEIVPADPSKELVYCHAIIRVGSLKEKNANTQKSRQSEQPRFPDRIKDCSRWVDAFFYYVNPPSSAIRCYTPSGGPNPLWSPTFGGRDTRYQWGKLDDGGTYELEHLTLLSDLIPPLPLNYEDAGLKGIIKYQMPTMSLNINFRADVKGHEWLLARTHMQWLDNGRFDENIDMFDVDGNIVATCHQACAIFPAKWGGKKDVKGRL